jgi:hypothetical protein
LEGSEYPVDVIDLGLRTVVHLPVITNLPTRAFPASKGSNSDL